MVHGMLWTILPFKLLKISLNIGIEQSRSIEYLPWAASKSRILAARWRLNPRILTLIAIITPTSSSVHVWPRGGFFISIHSIFALELRNSSATHFSMALSISSISAQRMVRLEKWNSKIDSGRQFHRFTSSI